jgi:RimJ/RimL family protein N-acetyltransferase
VTEPVSASEAGPVPEPADRVDTDPLETARLVLRRWTAADRAPFAALNADPEVMRYFPGTLSRRQSDALADSIEATFERYGFGLWAVEVKGGPPFVGFTGLAPLNPLVPYPGIEVGWRLARPAWGHGYATEAARASVAHGFGAAGLAEIVSVTAAVNTPSRAVMRRLGMVHDPAEDFDHAVLAVGSPLRKHVIYRLRHRPSPGRPPSGSGLRAAPAGTPLPWTHSSRSAGSWSHR